jgi:hypothetical protein
MELSSVGSQSSMAVGSFASQAPVQQPQEQQARNVRSTRERDDATRANDQVTLSGAARQVSARETERVVPSTESSAISYKPQDENRVEQVRQAQSTSRENDTPAPRSVARALESYTQTAALSSGNS